MRRMKQLGRNFLGIATAAAMLLLQPIAFTTAAQAQEAGEQKLQFEGLTRPPSESEAKVLLDASDAVLLMLDHQTGLFQTVNDVPIADLRANAVTLVKIAEQADIPVIYTASEPEGPNGPIMEELEELAKTVPDMQYVPRQGEVSAWDNADIVDAVEATGRKTLVIAGVWTSVCVAFPAIQATAEGYTVYTVMDASGDVSNMASDAAMARMAAAGVIPVTTNTILSETHRTWDRPDWQEWLDLYAGLVPEYHAAVENYNAAQGTSGDAEAAE